MNNKSIRAAMFECGMRQWELAGLMGISEAHMSRKLRYELPVEEQERILALILEHGAPQYENQNHTERI